MQNLGKKSKELYDTPGTKASEENRIIYPEVRLPLDVVDGKNFKKGDKVSFKSTGIVAGIEDTKWSQHIIVEAHEVI